MFLIVSKVYQSGSISISQSFLNAALYCDDCLSSSYSKALSGHCRELKSQLICASQDCSSSTTLGELFTGKYPDLPADDHSLGIVLISPNPFSLYTICVYKILRILNIPVKAIVIRNFSYARFVAEWKRDGSRLIKKIWRKLILREDENHAITAVSLKTVYDSIAPEIKDICHQAKCDGVEVIQVNCFEDCLQHLSKIPADLALFTGGGLISSSMINMFCKGIVNVHMGGLPQFKGMDVPQAAVLEGHFNCVTITSHLMDSGLDTGPVISRFNLTSDDYSSVGAMRNELSAVSPFLSVYSALGLISGRIAPVIQPSEGRQYYILHPKLTSMVDKVMMARYKQPIKSFPLLTLSDLISSFSYANP